MATAAAGLANVALNYVNLPGLGRGRRRMRPGPNGAVLVHSTQPAVGAARAAGPGRAGPSPTNQGGVTFTRDLSIGKDWFDHIHILPRAKIDFGNIVTPVTSPYEIFNAFATPVSFLSFVNYAGSGITLPSLTAPVTVLEGYSSFLDPTTVRGTQVQLNVTAGPDGPASFDSYIHFVFDPGNEVDLFLKGSRIALLTPEAETPIIEELRFGTSVLELAGGGEQRISLRKMPRQSFQYEYLIETAERRAVQSLFFGWQASKFGLPLWHERLLLSAAVGAGANSATVVSTSNVDLRVGGYAVLFKSRTVFDVLQISAITSTTVTFTSNTANAYAANDLLMPIRTVRVDGRLSGTRFPVTVERFRPSFESVDNDTGVSLASAAGFSSYGGRVLLDGNNVMNGAELEEEFVQKMTTIDGDAGLVYQVSDWTRHKRRFTIGFAPTTRAGLYSLRQLLYYLRGRQTAFWVPTFITDLTVAATLSSGSNQMQIDNVGYTRYVASKQPKATFKILFTDGSSLVRTIQSSVETSATIETLTLDTTWPSTKLASEVSDVQFYELCRFDTDDFRIVHNGIGRAKLFAPVTVVFDT